MGTVGIGDPNLQIAGSFGTPDQVTVGRQARIPIVGRVIRDTTHDPGFAGDGPNLEVATAVGGEQNLLPIGRVSRLPVCAVAQGEKARAARVGADWQLLEVFA